MQQALLTVARTCRANPVAGILVVFALLCALLIALKIYRERSAPHPESLRKLLHVGMGLVTLSFPWLFASPWPVIVLASAAAVLLIAVKAPGPLRSIMGGVVDGVDRKGHGDLYFPISVVALFWLAQGDKILFCVPILLLTLGDAAAALVGVRYGRHHFLCGSSRKSAEGSLACFLVGFLCTLFPLTLYSDTGHAQALIIAVIVGLLTALLEAVAWSGLDNLFVPLGGYLLLQTYRAMPIQALVSHFFVTLALFIFVVLWRRRGSLSDSAALGVALYGYCAWSIGGLDWLFAPVLLFIGYPLMWPHARPDAGRTHTLSVVVCVGAAGLLWLFISAAFRKPEWIYLYNVAFGAEMAMIGLARLRHRYPQASGAILIAVAVAGSWLLLVVPPLVAATPRAHQPGRALAAWIALSLAAILFDRLRRDLREYPCDPARWRLQAALGAVGSAAGLVPVLLGS